MISASPGTTCGPVGPLAPPIMSDWDRTALATALVRADEPPVVLDLLVAPTCVTAVQDALSTLGATIAFADPRTGFMQLRLSPGRVGPAARLPGVQALSFPESFPDARAVAPTEDGTASILPVALGIPRVDTAWGQTRWASDTINEPYFAAADVGLGRLRRAQPGADGRDVRVAVVDDGIDLLHPALGPALDREGQPIPKIADVHTTSDPGEVTAAGWVRFPDSARVASGRLVTSVGTWQAPADAVEGLWYRVGVFRMNLRLGTLLDYRAATLTVRVGVLWDRKRNRVWVATRGNGDFRDARAITDYRESHEVGWFGSKADSADDRIPFTVQTDPGQDGVHIAIARGHGTLVAGALAATRRSGGLFDGAAPAAQLVDEQTGPTVLPGLVAAAARPDVDIVNRSGGIGRIVGGGREDFEQRVVEQLLDVYRKPLVLFGAAPGSVQVLDYVSADAIRRNRQLAPPYTEAMNSFTWWRSDGAINTVLAPSTSLALQSRVVPFEPTDSLGRLVTGDPAHRFGPPAPWGYVIGANPSPTIPIVSGVLASVLSLAKRYRIPYDGRRLTHALFASSRLVTGFPTYEQGYGLVQADSLWLYLQNMARADAGADLLTYFTAARPVYPTHSGAGNRRVEVTGFLEEIADDNASELPMLSRTLWLTRHGGPVAARAYRLAWRGNDSAFALPVDTVTFVAGRPAPVQFDVRRTPGWHLAFLRLIDQATGAVMQEVPITVRLPLPSQAPAPAVRVYTDTVGVRRIHRSYFAVHGGAQAVRVTMLAPHDGGENWRVVAGPSGQAESTVVVRRDSSEADPAHHVGPVETRVTFIADPVPGTYVVGSENRGRPEYEAPGEPPAPTVPIVVRTTVEEFAVHIQRKGDTLLQATNTGAALAGRAEAYLAGVTSAPVHFDARGVLADQPLDVPVRTIALRAAVRLRRAVDRDRREGALTLTDTVADLFAFDCTAGRNRCVAAASAPVVAGGAPLMVRAPRPGSWRYAVLWRFSRSRPSRALAMTLTSAVIGPATGLLAVTDTFALRLHGAIWRVPLQFTAIRARRSAGLYAGFRLMPDSLAPNGSLIGLTAVTQGAP